MSDEAELRQTVLVVEDDRSVRLLLEQMLEQDGHLVVTAEDGAAALELVETEEPDLVLLDVMMPGPSGFEVCQRLKASPRTRLLPIILVTGLDARTDRLAGIEAGADDFLSKPFDPPELIARVRSLLRMKRYTDELERAESVVVVLALAIEERDPYTRGHCDRLAMMSSQLGRRMGLDPARVVALERAGYLHDLGKITVPDSILHKEGRLTREEWELMRGHAEAGERICRGLRSLQPVLPIIRHHHERLDGSGYPDGLSGDEVPLTARILQVVDVYDALTTERPYKPAFPQDEALAILQTEVDRGWWDPDVYEQFLAVLDGLGRSGASPAASG